MQKIEWFPSLNLMRTCGEAGINWEDLRCTEMAENDSFVKIDCDDAMLEELNEECDPEYCSERDLLKIQNDIKLITWLRNGYGFRSTVLLWLSW